MIEKLLQQARHMIEVLAEEIDEAKRRRQLIADALRREFPGCRIFFNGSLAHGDAKDPLSDFDLGVVVPDPDGRFGPGRQSANALKERARNAIRDALEEEFPNLRIEMEGRKRSVLIRFSDPVSERAIDFTGDLICAIDHPERGLWIPKHDSWDRSHPEEHTQLVLEAIARTKVVYARAMRLLKYWNERHGETFCSWHMKVLAMGAITEPVDLIRALELFFEHASNALRLGPTRDPAGVGPVIEPNVPVSEAIDRVVGALGHVRAAVEADANGRPLRAQAELAVLLPDIVADPDEDLLLDEERRFEVGRISVGASTGVGAGANLALPRNRGWSDR